MNTVSSTGRSSAVTDSRSTTPSSRDAAAVELGRGLAIAARPVRRRPLGRLLGERADARTAAPRSRPCARARCGPRAIITSEHREHRDVQRVEAQQRALADLVAADEQVLELAADQRDVVHEVGADGDRPVR